MAAFRILNQFPVYRGADDLPLVGGELRFYESGTTTPKSVFGDPGLTIDNGPVIAIGSDGRPADSSGIPISIWGDGSYRVRLYDGDGTLVPGCEADDVEIPGGDAATIPTLVDGYWLTNNGSLLLWAFRLDLPDPTGQDGKMVVADGAGYILQPIPEPPVPVDPDIVVDSVAKTFQAGVSDDPTKWFVQFGTGSAPASGSENTSVSVVFPEPFGAYWMTLVEQTHNGVTPFAAIPQQSLTAESTTGFSVRFSTEENSDASGWAITSSVPFKWVAFGTREVEPAP